MTTLTMTDMTMMLLMMMTMITKCWTVEVVNVASSPVTVFASYVLIGTHD